MSDAQVSQPTEANTNPQPVPPTEAVSTIPKEEFERVLSDMHKFKRLAQENEAKAKQLEVERLKSQQDYKALYEQNDSALKQKELELAAIKKGLVNNTKFSALKTEALKQGVHESALDDLTRFDWPDVVVTQNDNQEVLVAGVERAIQRLKTQKPFFFKAPTIPTVNNGTPNVIDGGTVTMQQVLEAEKAAKKSGDYAGYQKLLGTWQQQTRK